MECDPEDAVFGTKSGTLLSPQVDGEWLAQGGVFQGQGCPRHQYGPDDSDESR